MTADMLHRRIAHLEAQVAQLQADNEVLRTALVAVADDTDHALDFVFGPYPGPVKP